MADRSFMYCPLCEKTHDIQVELFRGMPESHIFRCEQGHAFTYQRLIELNPTKIKLVTHEKPGPNDVKAEFWVNPKVLQDFRSKYANQQNSTINSILFLLLDEDLLMISGEQARKLKALGISTGADMLTTAEQIRTLTVENESLVKENDRFYRAIAARQSEVEA
jgi:hypothetical protein